MNGTSRAYACGTSHATCPDAFVEEAVKPLE